MPSHPLSCQVFLWKAKCNLCNFFWQTFIESLSTSQLDHLLLDVLSNGQGSLDYAKPLVANSDDPDPNRPANTNCPNWCICNVCMDMGNYLTTFNAVRIGPVSSPMRCLDTLFWTGRC